MALADFLQQLLRQPGGPQNALAQAASAQGSAGPNGSAAYQNALQAAFQAQATPQAAPQGVSPMQTGSVAPQTPRALMAAPATDAPASGGNVLSGLFNGLQGLLDPQARGRNQTIDYLTKQGYDPGTAAVIASDKPALRQVLLGGTKKSEFDQRAAAATQYGIDPATPQGRNFILTGKLEGPQREIKNDANGVPRYVDTGAAVYPSDQSASSGTQFLAGRGVEAQGLNYLVDKGIITKEQAANMAAGKTITGPNNEIIFATPEGIFKRPSGGGAATPMQPGQAQNPNITLTSPRYSEDMRKAGGFAMRAAEADKIISQPNITSAAASALENGLSAIPFVGNYAVSSDFQQSDQAQRNFVNAVLRRESGAAISESEFQNARKQYFPQPGDGPAVLQQKEENRKTAIESLRQSANPVPAFDGSSSPDVPSPQISTPAVSSGTNPTSALLTGDKPPAGWEGKPELWPYMSPKDRALWMK